MNSNSLPNLTSDFQTLHKLETLYLQYNEITHIENRNFPRID